MSDQLLDQFGPIETISKLFAFSLGLLYLVGFLVVASYLSRYGVSSFSALQLQYLIAGIWVIGPPVILGTLSQTAHRLEERAAPEVGGTFNWRRFAIASAVTGIPSIVFISLLTLIPNISESLSWGAGLRLYAFGLAALVCSKLFWRSLRVETAKEALWVNRSHAAPFYAGCLFVILVGYSVWFSARIYPVIPYSLGGGKPLTIEFVEGDKKMPDEIAKADSSARHSIPYQLLLATDKSYYVMSSSSNEKSIEINHDSVGGIIVLK